MREDWYFNVFDELVYISDVETYELLYMNKTCRDLAKQGEQEYQGKKCYQVLQGLNAPCPFCNNHLLTSLSFKRGRAGQPDTFYSVGIDISEYKREIERSARALQDALADAQQASLAKGRFLSRMSHEIRTPLNAVIGMASIASMSLDNKAVLCNCHKKIDSSAKYLLSLINDILDVSRIESGKLELFQQEVSLQDFLSDIKSMFTLQALEGQIHFSLEADEVATTLTGDPLRFKQVVVNLLSNALKFTQPGGEVLLKVGELSCDRDTVWLEIVVKDTGMGISREAQGRIFDTFEQQDSAVTSRFGGAGLGLSISKHIVGLMGGTIAVRSELGVGSCFVVQVPFALQGQTAPTPATDKEHMSKEYDFRGKRVLVVEDNDLNQEILVVLLEARGLHVEVATNGREALSSLQAQPHDHFDLILMDICMPVMDGLTATRAIRHLPHAVADIPIIALSANAFEEDRRRSLDRGMEAHVSKPIDMTDLFTEMHTVLTRPVPDRHLQKFLRQVSLPH